MNYWLLVTHPNNFEIMKAKRKNFAERVKIGDKVVFYLTKIGQFGGSAYRIFRPGIENGNRNSLRIGKGDA